MSIVETHYWEFATHLTTSQICSECEHAISNHTLTIDTYCIGHSNDSFFANPDRIDPKSICPICATKLKNNKCPQCSVIRNTIQTSCPAEENL